MARPFTVRKTFSEIEKLSESQLRKEYTTLRDIFRKRIIRLAEKGSAKVKPFLRGGWAYVPTLQERKNIPGIRSLTAEQKKQDLIFAVKELTNLVGTRDRGLPSAGVLSITGLARERKTVNEQILDSLHESGYEHISKSTLKKFGDFMDKMREQYGRKLPNSEEMAEFFDNLKYNAKKKSTQFIMELWREYEENDYEPSYGSVDLFRT